MAYTGKDTLLGTVKLTDKTELRISQVEDTDFNGVDIRTWYCTEKNPEMQITRKGVRFKEECGAEVVDLILKGLSPVERQRAIDTMLAVANRSK